MLIRPRLTEHHGIHIPQQELDFAIPFLNEDTPLYLDPFLLWKSPSQQDNALHQMILGGFNNLGGLVRAGRIDDATAQLVIASECDEIGLGNSTTRKGKRIGQGKAREILALFEQIPHYRDYGFRHIEEVQLFVEGVKRDRISDIACSFLKSFLIDYTYQECKDNGIPTQATTVTDVYHVREKIFKQITTELPCHPNDESPILFVPKRWLRYNPWINYDHYFREACPQDDIAHDGEALERVKVLSYNRDNYGVIDQYIRERERTANDCATDPLFKQIPILSARRKLATIKKLPTGKDDGADRKYEDAIGELFASLLYPQLDFADVQVRTESGVSIRDLIFYNSQNHDFLNEIMTDYSARQITMEMKNVKELKREHVDQLNRYLHDDLGKFGVFITRTAPKKAIFQRMIDLWSGQRKALIVLTDQDVEQMVEVFESKQRLPLDVLKKKYIEFRRSCP